MKTKTTETIRMPEPRPIPAWCEDGVPIDVPAKGRGKFRATATADPGGITIRVDDDRDRAFWLELRLSEGDVIHLMEVAGGCPNYDAPAIAGTVLAVADPDDGESVPF